MKKLFRGIVLAGVVAGAIYAAKNLFDGGGQSSDEATLTFTDGTTALLSTADIQGQELVDIARKLIESGV